LPIEFHTYTIVPKKTEKIKAKFRKNGPLQEESYLKFQFFICNYL